MSTINTTSFTNINTILQTVTQKMGSTNSSSPSPTNSDYSLIECSDSPISSHPSMPDLTINKYGDTLIYIAAGVWPDQQPDQQKQGFDYI